MKPTFLLLALSASYALAQGPLTPPGAPAPTMKTLAQIEARTAIPATPGFTFGGPFFTITTSGSYYLTGNVEVSTGNGILINADDVTLDLNGFRISSGLTGGASGSGIDIQSGRQRIAIKNGSIFSRSAVSSTTGVVTPAGFLIGIFTGGGTKSQITVTDVKVTGTSGDAIALSFEGSIIERCSAKNCGGGIVGDIVKDCVVENCSSIGIVASVASGCRASTFSNVGIDAGIAENCYGQSVNGIGLYFRENSQNCTGLSTNGIGLFCFENASNCRGRSTSATGMVCRGNATNCTGSSSTGPAGIEVTGTASFCRGSRPGGVAISAAIAIGCTSSNGTVVSPQKHLGTP